MSCINLVCLELKQDRFITWYQVLGEFFENLSKKQFFKVVSAAV